MKCPVCNIVETNPAFIARGKVNQMGIDAHITSQHPHWNGPNQRYYPIVCEMLRAGIDPDQVREWVKVTQ